MINYMINFIKMIFGFADDLIFESSERIDKNPHENSRWICLLRRIGFVFAILIVLKQLWDYTVFIPIHFFRPISGKITLLFTGNQRLYILIGGFLCMCIITMILCALLLLYFRFIRKDEEYNLLKYEYHETVLLIIPAFFNLLFWIWMCLYNGYLFVKSIVGNSFDTLDNLVVIFMIVYSVYVYLRRQFWVTHYYAFRKKSNRYKRSEGKD